MKKAWAALIVALGMCASIGSYKWHVNEAHAAVRSDMPGAISYGAVNVLNSAATKVPTTCRTDRNAIAVFNNGPNTIWCGSDPSVTTSTGYPVAAASWLSVDVRCNVDGTAGIYCIASTADQSSPSNTRYLEVR